MDSTLLLKYAEVGAQVRLRELDEERQRILDVFPNLNGATDTLPDTSEIGEVLRKRIVIPVPTNVYAEPGQRKPMSQRQKKAISRRMKAYWREKRKTA